MHAGLSPSSTEDVDDMNREVARAIAAWDEATDDAGAGATRVTRTPRCKETVAAAAADLERIAAAVKRRRTGR